MVKAPPVAMKIFMVPKLVSDDVPDDQKPPENKDLEDVKIGDVNRTGGADVGVDAGPAAAVGKGIVETPRNAHKGSQPSLASKIR